MIDNGQHKHRAARGLRSIYLEFTRQSGPPEVFIFHNIAECSYGIPVPSLATTTSREAEAVPSAHCPLCGVRRPWRGPRQGGGKWSPTRGTRLQLSGHSTSLSRPPPTNCQNTYSIPLHTTTLHTPLPLRAAPTIKTRHFSHKQHFILLMMVPSNGIFCIL